MRLTVRHGINGTEELTVQVVAGVSVGWDVMQQLARRLALDSPFQIVLYMNSTAAVLSPVRAISYHTFPTDTLSMLSGTEITVPNRRALSIANDCSK